MSNLIQQIHDTPHRGVLVVTGGGSSAISQLLAEPGASRTVLNAVVPYSEAALHGWIGGQCDSACSEATARAMAMAACESAQDCSELADAADGLFFGVGATASLASDRPKRGAHRVYVALQTVERTSVWSLELEKGRRTRSEEEAVTAQLILHAVATACGLAAAEKFSPVGTGRLTFREKWASPLWRDLLWGLGENILVDAAAGDQPASDSYCKRAIFPGSFAPAHEGHKQIRDVACKQLGNEATLELSVVNVSKPPVDFLSLEERLQSIVTLMPDAQVWLTRAATFVEKARSLPGATFIVGADTIVRIGDPAFYAPTDNSLKTARDIAIGELADLGCRFLVFGRKNGPRFETLDNLTLPPALRELCDGVPESGFRQDVSSSDLRQESSPEG